RHQHAVHGLPGHPFRWVQAVGFRARARDRDAQALPRDEVGDHLHRLAADESLRPVAELDASVVEERRALEAQLGRRDVVERRSAVPEQHREHADTELLVEIACGSDVADEASVQPDLELPPTTPAMLSRPTRPACTCPGASPPDLAESAGRAARWMSSRGGALGLLQERRSAGHVPGTVPVTWPEWAAWTACCSASTSSTRSARRGSATRRRRTPPTSCAPGGCARPGSSSRQTALGTPS